MLVISGIEYLLVYTQHGLPIYSKCFGTFCKTAFKEPELLSSFLSAIETIPPTLSAGLSLKSITMSNSIMRFSKTTPTGHTVVIGLSQDTGKIADEVYTSVSDILNSERFRSVDWTVITQNLMDDFRKELLTKSLAQALHGHEGFVDECPLGDQCPLHTDAVQFRRRHIWSVIRDNYVRLRARVMKNPS